MAGNAERWRAAFRPRNVQLTILKCAWRREEELATISDSIAAPTLPAFLRPGAMIAGVGHVMHGTSTVARLGLAGLIGACSAAGLSAQSSPISPDRPGVSYGAATVPRGRFQLESGVEFRSADGGGSLLALPFAVLRAGVGDRTDLLVSLPTWSRTSGDGLADDGFGDLSLGARHRVAEGGAVRAALLGLVTLPTGAEGFSGTTTFRAGVAADADVGGGATLFSTGFVALMERDDRFAADLELSVGVGGALGGRASGFVEAYAQTRSHAAADNGGFLAGLGWLLSNDLQFDVYAGLDVVSPATLIGGAGFSIRW